MKLLDFVSDSVLLVEPSAIPTILYANEAAKKIISSKEESTDQSKGLICDGNILTEQLYS